MWYVIQVRTGTEENIRLQCEANIPEEIMEHLHTHRRLYLASTPPTVQTALDELPQCREA